MNSDHSTPRLVLVCLLFLNSLNFSVRGQTHLSKLVNYAGPNGISLNGPNDVFINNGYAYVVSSANNSLEIINISNPSLPIHVSTVYDGVASNGGVFKLKNPRSIFVSNGKAYVGSFDTIEIIDVRNPYIPVHKGNIVNGFQGAVINSPTIFVVDQRIYLANAGTSTFSVITTNGDGSVPFPFGKISRGTGGALLGGMSDLFVAGNFAYVTSTWDNALEIIDISVNPPQYKGKIVNGSNGASLRSPKSVHVQGTKAYVTSLENSLEIIDVSVPTAPVHVSKSASDGRYSDKSVFVSGNYAYVANWAYNEMIIFNVFDPSNTVLTSTLKHGSGGALLKAPKAIYVSGTHAYLASAESNSLEIIDVSDALVPFHKGSVTNVIGGALLNEPSSVYISGNYAYVASKSSNALEIVDITNPSSPIHKGGIIHGEGGALLKQPSSVFVRGNYAYLTAQGSDAVEIVDITDPVAPVHKGKITNGAGGANLGQPTSIFVSGDYAYVTSSQLNALEILNISNPANPTHVGLLANGTGGAALVSASSVVVRGNFAYVASGNALEIVDVTNPALPAHAGKLLNSATAALDNAKSVCISGNFAYVASYISNALEIVNIASPTNPFHVGKIVASSSVKLRYPTSVYVSGNFAYVAAGADNALEIINVANPASPTHVTNITHGTGGALLDSPTSVFGQGNYLFVTGALSNSLEIVSHPVATTITTQPSPLSQTVCKNATVNPLSITATGVAPLTYQWYRSGSNSNTGGIAVNGAVSATYTPSAVLGTSYYYVVVNGYGGSVTSQVSGAVTINPSTVITSHPSSVGETVNLNGAPNTLLVGATGSGSMTYQWYKNNTNSNLGGNAIVAATSPTYTPSSAVAGTNYYYATVAGGCGTETSTPSGAITVLKSNQTITFNSLPSICAGGSLDLSSYASASSALPLTFVSSNESVVSISGSLMTVNNSGTVTITAQQEGNSNYDAAVSVPQSLTVTACGVSINVLGNTVFCEGGSLRLVANTDFHSSTFLWSNGLKTSYIDVRTSGIYSVVARFNIDGSVHTSNSVEVTVVPNTGGGNIVSSSTCFDGSTFTLSTSPVGTDHLWSTSGTTPFIVLNPPNAPSTVLNYQVSYKINGTSATGCYDMPSCSWYRLGSEHGDEEKVRSTSVYELEHPLELTLHPNPADVEITLRLPNIAETDVQIQVIDKSGRLVLDGTVTVGTNTTTLNVRDLPSSVYLLKLTENGRVTYKRAMVVHRN